MLRRQLPNLITLCNLLCGTVAAYLAALGNTHTAALMICLGILFDFFDGLSARLLKVSSPLGKELDSLADVVTSGVAPAMIILTLIERQMPGTYLSAIAFLVPMFAAYRLAKFNLDARQAHSFLGLPVPSNALIWVGIALSNIVPEQSTATAIAMAVLSLIGNVLMISEMPLFSLKFDFHRLAWRDNKVQYLFLIGCAIIIALLRDWIAISAIILWYIIFSAATQHRHANQS